MSRRNTWRMAARRRPARNRLHSANSPTGRSHYRRPLRLEPLEDRRLLAVVTVTTLADTIDFNDGVTSLREAIFATNTVPGADTIEFDPSLTTGDPQTILLEHGELAITEELTINGPGASLLTIDAQEQSRIFNITATMGDFAFSVLTLTGGRTTGNNSSSIDTTYSGGAIRSLTSGQLSLEHSNVSGSGTEGFYASGGGIFARGNVVLTQSILINNSTAGDLAPGGAVDARGRVELNESTISGNSTEGYDADGGGINARGSVTLSQSTVSGNSTMGDFSSGGGISCRDSVTLTQSSVSGNSTVGRGASGGGVLAGEAALIQSTVSGNRTMGDFAVGGGISTVVPLTNVLAAGIITLTQSTVSGNSTAGASASGGGMIGGKTTLIQSTVTDNHATGPGATAGGLSGFGVISTGSIVAGNLAAGGNPELRSGTTVVVSQSLIGDSAGTALVEAPVGLPDADGNLIGGPMHGVIDPLLGPLADNGGFELPDGSHILTHALLAGSPAINAGDLNAVAGPNGVPEFDQRGEPFERIVGGRIDIGAFEYQTPTDLNLLVDTLEDESDGNYSRGDLSLREAIELANAANYAGVVDTIHFDPALTAAGPASIRLIHGELKITDSLTINGPGADLLTIDASGNDPTPTLHDGKGSRIYSVQTLEAFVVRGQTITGGDSNLRGGAIFQKRANLTLQDTIGTGNATREFGGGIYASDGSVEIESTSISSNAAVEEGGGLCVRSSDLAIRDSTISGNSADTGGGIHIQDYDRLSQQIVIVRTTITGNRAERDGGGVWANTFLATISVRGSTIEDNIARRGGGVYAYLKNGSAAFIDSALVRNDALWGGGMFATVVNGELTLSQMLISGNHAFGSGQSGGGVYLDGYASATTISDSTISSNDAWLGAGGGLFVKRGWLTVENCTLHANSAGTIGGGICQESGDLDVLHSTVTGNSTRQTNGGGGIARLSGTASETMLGHTIIAGNYAGHFALSDILNSSDTASLDVYFSLIGYNSESGLAESVSGGPDASGNLIGGPVHGVIDPKLGPLADNGGPTMTHALLPGSPAINAGDPTAVAGADGVPIHDQRGVPFTRVYGGRIDIGAVESIPAGLLPGDYNFNGVVDAADYTVWRDALGAPHPGPLPMEEGVVGDGNGDGVVDALDYSVWKSNFGATAAELGAGSAEQGVTIIRDEPPAKPGTEGRELVAALIGDSTQQPPAQPGVSRRLVHRTNDIAAARQDRLLAAWAGSRTPSGNNARPDTTARIGIRQGDTATGTRGALGSIADWQVVDAAFTRLGGL